MPPMSKNDNTPEGGNWHRVGNNALGPTKMTSFRLPTDTLNTINAVAKTEGVSKAHVVRVAVAAYAGEQGEGGS